MVSMARAQYGHVGSTNMTMVTGADAGPNWGSASLTGTAAFALSVEGARSRGAGGLGGAASARGVTAGDGPWPVAHAMSATATTIERSGRR